MNTVDVICDGAVFRYIADGGQGAFHAVDVSRFGHTVRFVARDAQGIQWQPSLSWAPMNSVAAVLGFPDSSAMWRGIAHGLLETVRLHAHQTEKGAA